MQILITGGAPIHITYPGSVIGPDDPGLTDPHQGLVSYLSGTIPIPPSGNQWVDVRDIALVHRATPLDIPITYEAMTYATHWVKMDDSKALAA